LQPAARNTQSASMTTCRTSTWSSRWPTASIPCAAATRRVCTTCFRASAATLLEVAADSRHLGATVGFLSILHTRGQTLVQHPHVHCVVPAGGFSPDGRRWVIRKYAGFFSPVKVLSRCFAANSSRDCAARMPAVSWISAARPASSVTQLAGPHSSTRCFARSGSYMRSQPSAQPSRTRCCDSVARRAWQQRGNGSRIGPRSGKCLGKTPKNWR
jgi:hypothetical protein